MRSRRKIVFALISAGAILMVPRRVMAASAAASPPARGLSLVMVERIGCSYCAAWNREILPFYRDHPEGRAAPLSVVQIDGPWPDGIALARSPYLTPSFILLRDRREVARIEGYPGKTRFWPLFREMLDSDAALNPGAAR